MVGGPDDAVERLTPIFDALAPGVEAAERTPEREAGGAAPTPAERGWLHCGPSGAGHFVKMVHNGIEYGVMAAYAEGFNVLGHGQHRVRGPSRRCRDGAARRAAVLPLRPEPGGHRRGVAARLGDLQLVARPHRPGSRRRSSPRPRSRATSATRARVVGRSPRLSMRACRCRSSRQRCSLGSVPAVGRWLLTRSSPPCGRGSAGTSSGRRQRDDDRRAGLPANRRCARPVRSDGRPGEAEALSGALLPDEAGPARRSGDRCGA